MEDETDELTDEEFEAIIDKHLSDIIEFYKIRVDLFKHLSTLSSGSIVLLVAFSDDVLKAGSNGFLIAALVGFIITILFSAWTCFQTLGVMIKTKELLNGLIAVDELAKVEKGNWVNFVAMFSFLSAMVSLVIYVIQKLP